MKSMTLKLTFFFAFMAFCFAASAQTQYVSFNYKSYKIGFKAPSDFKIVKNSTTEFSINSTERGLAFYLRPVKEDATVDVNSSVELAKMAMVDVNAQYTNVTVTEETDVILSGGLSGYYMTGTCTNGSVKTTFFAIGVYNASTTMQFKGVGTYPVDRRSTSNLDVCKRILQSMQVI
jgi:hypothetical protein